VNANTGVGVGIDINSDGTYEGKLIQLTNTAPVTANEQLEEGNWSASPTTLTLTPTQWSCTGADPASTATYTLSGGSLVVNTSSGAVTFMRDTTPPPSASAVTYGCFDANGNFTAQPLGPVQ
jgi:hypothetical protein